MGYTKGQKRMSIRVGWRIGLVGVLLVVVGIAVVYLYLRSVQEAPVIVGSGTPEFTPEATAEDTAESTPTGEIAFMSHRDGNWEIYAMNADGSSSRNLTRNPAQDWFQSYALDSQQINFISNRAGEDGPSQMKPDGSDPRSLSVVAAILTLVSEKRYDWDPKWSPDGTQLMWVSLRDLNLEIYVKPVNADTKTRLTTDPGYDWYPVWSPDGRQIAFSSTRDGNEEIYVMNADGSHLRRLTNTPADELAPFWSLDGKYIAFMSERDNTLDSGALDLFVADAATGTQVKKITSETVFEGGANWSADNRFVLYMSNRDGNWNIYVMNKDGSHVQRLTDNTSDNLYPIWRP